VVAGCPCIAGDNRLHPPGHKRNADDERRGRSGLDRAGTEAIRLTEAEGLTLQGFPPGYRIVGASASSRWRQIGNAVPPPLAAAIGRIALT
jgi:site-specific DNA-cytosine methylase